ncbi:MAG: hypothetical protein JNL24_05435 [Bacteroidia bacterium]|nr:hypothetical protein [Bacteroidia bacterium]
MRSKSNFVLKFPANIILFFIVLYCFYLYSSYKEDKLRKCFKVCNAMIVDAQHGYRGGVKLSYEYIVGKKKYRYSSKRPISMGLGQSLINKNLLVIYSCYDFNENWLLLHKSDFEKYNIAYPDSLLWLKEELDKGR